MFIAVSALKGQTTRRCGFDWQDFLTSGIHNVERNAALAFFRSAAHRAGRGPRTATREVFALNGNGPGTSRRPGDRKLGPNKDLLSDIERFRRQSPGNAEKIQVGESKPVAGRLRSWLTNLLIADAFLVFFFMAWLVVGVILQLTSGYSALLDVWYILWQPVVQPLLGLLMAGALASKFLR
ncbi:hypothetical protein, conserved [Cyanidioschyzon merolae strain 10D]|uniref:Uncharacterized protein n=1 Tax=Cyanidioschyzon merolae (strain NIES-3377 / 10D) TaxID=280699 RepID=M1V739_CYAM1|nr:hypothetical protein, conserved [Cyanidioschyzon merolae strain 10D]BAM82745.1 hypothetical protein, conserved [Cyanidioschyzon merolae strain 10D]|eukprot:XP_005538781.1 hypothetical protein, conserved [Cyanidioschyzon merolae strain 10D]